MEEKFVITEIKRIVMVGKNEYSEPMLSFGHTLNYNELIFHFSGHATVFFDDLVLETKPNTIRFLPKGETKRYEVLFVLARVDKKDDTNLFSYKILFFRNLDILRCENH